jgi:hypothetical protein
MHDKIAMMSESWLDGMISRRPPPSKLERQRACESLDLMGAHKAKK